MTKKEILEKLEKIWEKLPDVTLGQLLVLSVNNNLDKILIIKDDQVIDELERYTGYIK